MTLANCERLMKFYEEMMKNPSGADLIERGEVKKMATKAYQDMKANIEKRGFKLASEKKGASENTKK